MLQAGVWSVSVPEIRFLTEYVVAGKEVRPYRTNFSIAAINTASTPGPVREIYCCVS